MPILKGTGSNPIAIKRGSTDFMRVYMGATIRWQKYTDPWILVLELVTNSNNTVTFDPAIYAVGKVTTDFRWDLGDGTEKNEQYFSYTYADGTNKTVRVYILNGSDFNNLSIGSDNIVGTIAFPTLKGDSTYSIALLCFDNPELTSVTFTSFDGKVVTLWFNDCDLTGTIDISMITELATANTEIKFSNNPNLTSLLLPSSLVTGKMRLFYVYNTGLSGTLDLSWIGEWYTGGYIWFYSTQISSLVLKSSLTVTNFRSLYGYSTALTGTLDLSEIDSIDRLDVRLNNCPDLTGVTFASSISGSLATLYLFRCDITGTLDLSMFTEMYNADLRLEYNSNMTGITLPSSYSGSIFFLTLQYCGFTGVVDLSRITALTSSGILYLGNNSGVTGFTFAASVSGNLLNFSANNCDITGTLDMSGFTAAAGINMNVSYNANMTGLVLPSSITTCSSITLNNCDLGYIDFSGYSSLLAKNSSSIRLFNNNMTAAEVNHILVDLAGLVSGEAAGGDYTGRYIYIGGTNAAPDGSSGGYDGLTAKTTLQGKGITVNTS